MAMYSSNQSNSWILSVKIALISTGVLSMAVVLKLSVPVVADFVSTEVPFLWAFFLSWLKPPYLYVVINFIIISIVASSKFQQKSSSTEDPPPFQQQHEEEENITGASGGVILSGYGCGASDVVAKVAEAEIVFGQERVVEAMISEAAEIEKEKEKKRDALEMAADKYGGGDGEAIVASMEWNGLQRKDSVDFSSFLNESEKPPVSARFGHRKGVKASPEGGKSLRVSKPKKQETLETTWKTITEGRPMPLTRHLKKSDTWDSHARRQQGDQSTPPPMKKSETFNDRSSLSPSPLVGSGKIRREPSLSQDELNRRVEAFIRKFNEEMRLQRQESLNQYREMIRCGAH